jgi:hypothetical protein
MVLVDVLKKAGATFLPVLKHCYDGGSSAGCAALEAVDVTDKRKSNPTTGK